MLNLFQQLYIITKALVNFQSGYVRRKLLKQVQHDDTVLPVLLLSYLLYSQFTHASSPKQSHRPLSLYPPRGMLNSRYTITVVHTIFYHRLITNLCMRRNNSFSIRSTSPTHHVRPPMAAGLSNNAVAYSSWWYSHLCKRHPQ